MGTDTDGAGGRMEIGQMWDADGAYGGIQMGTDAENSCPPLRRNGGEGGAAAWLSTLPPLAKQSQAVFQLRYFIFLNIACLGFSASKAHLKHPKIRVIMSSDTHSLSPTPAPWRAWTGSFMGLSIKHRLQLRSVPSLRVILTPSKRPAHDQHSALVPLEHYF